MAWTGPENGHTYIWNVQPGDEVTDGDVDALCAKWRDKGIPHTQLASLKRHPDGRANRDDLPDMSGITASDRLYISGHGRLAQRSKLFSTKGLLIKGCAGGVGNLGPIPMSDILVRAGLSAVGKVVLSSCVSGSKQAWYMSKHTVYAYQLLRKLRWANVSVGEVTGQRGILMIQKDEAEDAVAEVGHKRHAKLRGYRPNADCGPRVQFKGLHKVSKRTYA